MVRTKEQKIKGKDSYSEWIHDEIAKKQNKAKGKIQDEGSVDREEGENHSKKSQRK